MEEIVKKRMGRPPAGVGQHGEPERVSDYPKLAVTIRPLTRARLNAAALIENRPAWQLVDDSINQYIERMSNRDRKKVEAAAR
jgi:hypothetical protein